MPSDRQRLKAASRSSGAPSFQGEEKANDKAERKFLEKAEELSKRELARKHSAGKK
jgi:hypothetical protein